MNERKLTWKYQCHGEVVGLEEENDTTDEARCLIWFHGEGEDNHSIQILIPRDTAKLRDSLLVTIEPLMQKDRPETRKIGPVNKVFGDTEKQD